MNAYGDSESSLEGNGAIITTSPDPPTNLIEETIYRTKSTLAFKWTPPLFTGGDIILDYRVSIAELGGSFSILSSGVIPTSYTATSLTAGVTYQFKVESRNSYGYGSYSNPITMLCAFIPEPPSTVSTTNY